MNVRLTDVDTANMDKLCRLEVHESQKRYVPSAAGIIARAWVYRRQGAELFVITADENPVGMMLVYEVIEEPSCYYLMEMLVDKAWQGKGIGSEAVKQLVKMYSADPQFPVMEVSVDKDNATARRIYEKGGFSDGGYIDPELPQYVNLVYRF